VPENPWWLEWKTTTVQGRRASYGEAGRGTPFVFLHGWGLRDRTYQRALSRLASLGVRVLAPSLPGFEGTATLPHDDSFDLPGFADWVAAFMAAVGVDDGYYLGGHSFGGGVAIQSAHDHGERCELLVLVNSIGGAVWKHGEGDVQYLTDRPLWDWGIHFPQDVTGRRERWVVAPVVVQDALRNIVRDPVGFWRVGSIARHANLLPELEQLRSRGLPIAVLWGDEDAILPAASLDAIVTAIGHDAHIVEGTHTWLLADPDGFGEVMTNIVGVAERARLARLWPPPPTE
jgi:pimeloyl-ACP methyl ester carboxylesterase